MFTTTLPVVKQITQEITALQQQANNISFVFPIVNGLPTYIVKYHVVQRLKKHVDKYSRGR